MFSVIYHYMAYAIFCKNKVYKSIQAQNSLNLKIM